MHLSGLVESKIVRELLSTQQKSERVTTIVSKVNFADFDGVVSKVVVDDVGQVVIAGEETQNLLVVVEELFLAFDSATAERLLEELFHFLVLLEGERFL